MSDPQREPPGEASAPAPLDHAGDAEMLANRLRKNLRRLRPWLRREQVSCFRVYERDIPEIPLAIDLYEGRLHVAEYVRPHARSPEEQQAWLETLVGAAAAALEVPPEDVFVKRRERQKGLRQYQRVDEQRASFVVQEGGLRFRVNLSDYLDTGLFLDHRTTRSLVRAEAAGRRMLNLFAYTGAFSVYAAAGGARATTSVDLSPTYCRWGEENLALNELPRRLHHWVQSEIWSFFAEEERHRRSYDLVVLDPPTFSNSKRTPEVLDLQRDHAALLQRVIGLTAPGGIIYFSTNFRRFQLDEGAFDGAVAEEITARTLPPDFRDPKIHRCWRLVVRP